MISQKLSAVVRPSLRRAILPRSQVLGQLSYYSRRQYSASATESKNLPLEGLRILDLSRVLAGPFCTQILSDYGASVTKIEQPRIGDETRQWRATGESYIWESEKDKMSLYFSSINRNKRSVTLNLKSHKGVEIVKKLAAESDVVIHNFLPGSADKMGFGYEDLQALNDRLIYASVSGYGSSGPNSDRAGYDAIALAEAGLMHITGEAEGQPSKPGVAIVDICTGLYAHGAILAALAQRERTGKGTKIEGSLFETGLNLLINVGAAALNLDAAKPEKRRRGQRFGSEHPSLVPYGAFKAKDGKLLFLAANNNRQWHLLCETINQTGPFLQDAARDERFQTNDGRLSHRDEVNKILGNVVSQRTRDEWMALLEGSGLPYGAVNDVVEAVEHPQAAARDMIMNVDTDTMKSGKLKLVSPAVKFEGSEMGVRTNPPRLGEHTYDVLRELGYSVLEIDEMKAEGVV